MKVVSIPILLAFLITIQACSSGGSSGGAGIKRKPCPVFDNGSANSLKTPCRNIDGKLYIAK